MRSIVAVFAVLLMLDIPAGAQTHLAGGGKTHAEVMMQGWRVKFDLTLWEENREATTRFAELLDGQLQRVAEAVPANALIRLRRVTIWVNPEYPGIPPRAEYHSSADWLRENGRNPAMAKSIEFTNVRIFPFENRRMPYVALHELCHAYHEQVLSFDEPEIIAVYEAAKASGIYEQVQRFDGNTTVKDRAYALENHREYFAEITEAYFGRNDFFPFTNEELKSHDPEGYRIVKKMWGD